MNGRGVGTTRTMKPTRFPINHLIAGQLNKKFIQEYLPFDHTMRGAGTTARVLHGDEDG